MIADCVFCGIASGRLPAHMVHTDADLVVFLDRQPIRPGHLQIVPRLHVETFEALPAALAAKVMEAGQRLARAQKRLYGVDRVAFLFTGGDVPPRMRTSCRCTTGRTSPRAATSWIRS